MKTLIVYASFHHGNTRKIAAAINSVLPGEAVSYSELDPESLNEADLIGLGSGVYYSRFHQGLLELVRKMPDMKKRKTFIFSTSGIGRNWLLNRAHIHLRTLLEVKNATVLGEFDCRGYDTYGPLKYIGGIHKGRPDDRDLEAAKEFARSLTKGDYGN